MKAARQEPATRDQEKHYHDLLRLVQENPMRFFSVHDIQEIFRLPARTITNLRQLAQKEPLTDPWVGDLTTPLQFQDWFWKTRRRLEKMP